MKRRDFLKGGLGIAGFLLTSGIGYGRNTMAGSPEANSPMHHQHEEAIDPNERETVSHRFRHGGRQIEVIRRGNKKRMRIDGRELPKHYFSEVGGKYGSHLLPFNDFSDPRDLAKALIDNNGTLYKY